MKLGAFYQKRSQLFRLQAPERRTAEEAL